MAGLLKLFYEAQKEKLALRRSLYRQEAGLADLHTREFAEASNLFVDSESGPLFDMLSYQTMDSIDESSFETMLRNAWQLYRTDCYYHGLVELFVKFIIGSEARLLAKDEDPATQEALNEFCAPQEMADGRTEAGFTKRMTELVRRYSIFGDCGMRSFPNPMTGDIFYRFLNPIFMRSTGQFQGNPELDATFGVVTNGNDVEHILYFTYWPQFGMFGQVGQPHDPIPARQVVWVKSPDSLSDQKRGEPMMLTPTKKLIELQKLLQARQRFHRLSQLFAIQRIGRGGPAAITAARKNKKSTLSSPAGIREKLPDSGIVDVSPGQEIDIKTAALHAIDADVDVRRCLCEIFVCIGTSYTFGSADASQENYAAADNANHPFIKTIGAIQNYLRPTFAGCGRKYLQAKMDAGMLSDTSYQTEKKSSPGIAGETPTIISVSKKTIPRSTEVMVKYPDLLSTDALKEVQAMVLEKQMGWISDQEAISARGRNPDETKTQIRIEQMEKAENGMGDGLPTSQDQLTSMLMSRKRKDNTTGTAINKPILAGNGNGNGRS